MNEQLQQALLVIIHKTTNAVGASIDFLSGQIPDVIHQLLVWHAVKSGLLCTLFLVATSLVIFAVYKIEKKTQPIDRGIPSMVGIVVSIFLLFGASQNFEWLQILVAPKIFLIEYATSLVKAAT